MSMFGWMTIMTLFIFAMFLPMHMQDEMHETARYDAADSERISIFSYSNYVRDVLRKAQELKKLPNAESMSVTVYGKEIEGGASGLATINPEEFTNSQEGAEGENKLRVPYLSAGAMDRYKFGNLCIKDSDNKYWLYTWANPPSAKLDAILKTSLSKDRTSRFYIKNKDHLICANVPNETRSIPGTQGITDLIPNGAVVIISQPIEHGPTGDNFQEPNPGNSGTSNSEEETN